MRGLSELSLLAAVCVACWTRTPVGAAASGLVALAQDRPTPDLLASFRTELPADLQQALAVGLAQAPPPQPDPVAVDGWSPALRTAVVAHLGDDTLAELETLRAADPALAEPEAALEAWAVGPAVRARAVRRARAAGAQQPERLAGHRRFLPDEAAAAADRAVQETQALATVLDLAWPVDPDHRISSGFGYRTHPTLKTRKLHEGVDIPLVVGTPVHAAGDGRVSRARKDKVNGNYVKLDHGHGVSTAYCHGSAMLVAKGDQVVAGAHVMDSGNTGRSTGPHLHFGLRIGGRAVDPAPFRERGLAGSAASSTPESPATPGPASG